MSQFTECLDLYAKLSEYEKTRFRRSAFNRFKAGSHNGHQPRFKEWPKSDSLEDLYKLDLMKEAIKKYSLNELQNLLSL